MTYGISYQGGKSRIAEAIVGALPAADVLVDLFGGGGAVIMSQASLFHSSFVGLAKYVQKSPPNE